MRYTFPALAASAPTLAPTQAAVPVSRPLPYPMLWAALAFALGVLCSKAAAATGFWTPPNWQMLAAALLLLMAAMCSFKASPLASPCALLSIALLGAAQFNLGSAHPTAALPLELDNQEVGVEGFITRTSFPLLESAITHDDGTVSPPETYQQIDLRSEDIACPNASDIAIPSSRDGSCPVSTMQLGIRIGVYEPVSDEEAERTSDKPAIREFHYGQRLRISGRIRGPQVYGDPGVFDRRAYLLDNGISAVLNAKPDDILILPGFGGTRWGAWRARARESLLRHVLGLRTPEGGHRSVFSISQADAALLAAMILGERSLLDQRVKLDFQRTGSYHLLVVSGMAVAILAFAVYWFARLARLTDTTATILSGLFVALYVSLTDLGAPVQRAALMCAVYMLARLLYRERNPLNAIGAAALIALVADPKALFDAGFQMTFLAVLSIAGIAIPILERTTEFYRKALYQLDSTSFDLHLVPRQTQFRLDLRMVLSRLQLFAPGWLARLVLIGGVRLVLRAADVIFISALMQAALALPMAVYFHRATTLAFPANVAVVPIMSLLLPIAIATTLLSYLGAWIAFLPKCITALLLHAVSASVLTFAHFRASDLRVPDPPAWVSVLCLLAFAACILAVKLRPVLVLASLLLLGAADFTVLRARKPEITPGKLEITAIDVAQGDSLLVVTPQGKTLLIDGGGTLGADNSGFNMGEDVVSPYLWARGFSHLDAIALTHAHIDHIGGLPMVLKNFYPGELWVAPSPPTRTYLALITQARQARMIVYERVAGDKFNFGGAEFDVFAPPADAHVAQKRANDESMVLKIAFGNATALLEGDAERKTERFILPQLGSINVLKVAHHGSSTSSIPPLIAEIQPQFALISVGKFNRYGHPQNEILNRLGEAGACTFRTDLNGALSVFLNENGVTSARWGRQQQLMQFRSQWIPREKAGHCAALE